MQKNCIFCSRPLGTNEVIEHFPVGRRLAFDAEKGRLWVVCGKCERWNLSPLEERWEAVEACEQIFRGTRIRVSTEHIGLARHLEGLELVRIGQPLRPEFAAWRYGDQFGRRRNRALVHGAAAATVLGALTIGGAIAGGAAGNAWWIWNWWSTSRTLTKLRTDQGEIIKLKSPDLKKTRVRAGTSGEGILLEIDKSWKRGFSFEGDEAERHLGRIMPAVNRMGGRKDAVQEAVANIERHGHPERYLKTVATSLGYRRKGRPGFITKMPKPTRLALEMALHEEQERRALEGELWILEHAWREAEEIAAIADDLLLPEGTDEFLEKHRRSDGVAPEAPS